MSELKWTTSNRCGDGACVEVAEGTDTMLMRDNKDPNSPILTFTRGQWEGLRESLRAGQLHFGANTAR